MGAGERPTVGAKRAFRLVVGEVVGREHCFSFQLRPFHVRPLRLPAEAVRTAVSRRAA
jgi:hypothetical protein